MSKSVFSPAVHLSIAWGVTLAVVTLVEWNSLERDPMREQIFTPFIQREVSVGRGAVIPTTNIDFDSAQRAVNESVAPIQYTVKFHFDGPLFLACFFIPVFAFHGIGRLMSGIK